MKYFSTHLDQLFLCTTKGAHEGLFFKLSMRLKSVSVVV
nr:MAG TPA: hypothetical protein [Caudoviricetes sp.]DAY91491.1 MAG TPA: hypothetical protein [Caudoviricetes sp.]